MYVNKKSNQRIMKNVIYKLVLQLLFGLYTAVAWTQQAPQFTQYMYNTQTINPGYTGSRGVMGISAFHRSQWAGIDGAPETQSLTLGTPVGENVGLGLSVVNDRIGNGTNSTTDFGVDFSYAIRTSKEAKLSFGLNAGARLINTDFNNLRFFQPNFNGNALASTDQNFAPNLGVGAYYYTSNFYMGLSVPRVLTTDSFDLGNDSDTFLVQDALRVYGTIGWVTELAPNWKLKPAILVNTANGEPLNVDLSANFRYDEKLVLGASYRWAASVSLLTAFQFTDQILIGLAYDRETTALGGLQFNDGSFEVFLRYELPFANGKLINARFF